MIEIKLSFNTAAEAVVALAALAGKHDAPSGTVRAVEPVKAEPAAAVEPKVEPVKAPKAAKSSVTYADVKAAVGKLALIGAGTEGEPGRTAVKGVLKKLGLDTFQGSPEGCWGTAIELLTAEAVKLQAA